MKVYSLVASILVISSISACGGGGDENTLQAISGVWDLPSEDVSTANLAIRADGTGSEYYYIFSNFQQCYEKGDFTVTHDGGSRFTTLASDGNVTQTDMTVRNGLLRVAFEDGEIITLAPAGIVEADISPICE